MKEDVQLEVLVARLHGDERDAVRNQLIRALQEHRGVQVKSTDEAIALADPTTEAIRGAHDRARQLLKQRGKNVLVWGSVEALDGERKLYLFVTPRTKPSRHEIGIDGPSLEGRDLSIKGLTLPTGEVWKDVSTALASVLLMERARLLPEFNRIDYFKSADFLRWIAAMHRLVDDPAFEQHWAPEPRRAIYTEYAAALAEYGQDIGEPQPHRLALELSDRALALVVDDQDRIVLQNFRAMMLLLIGRNHSDLEMMEAAIRALRTVYESLPAESSDEGTSAINLALAYWFLGQRTGDRQYILEARRFAESALKDLAVGTYEWAHVQHIVGLVSYSNADELATLEQAIESIRASIKVYSREDNPALWGGGHSNLCAALGAAAFFERGAERRRRRAMAALRACQVAQAVFSRADRPIAWARLQMNRGQALSALPDTAVSTFEDAERAYRDAMEVFSGTGYVFEAAECRLSIANILKSKGSRESSEVILKEALHEIDTILSAESLASFAALRTRALHTRGNILFGLYSLASKMEFLSDAEQAYSDEERHCVSTGSVACRAQAAFALGAVRWGQKRYEQAAESYLRAKRFYEADNEPVAAGEAALKYGNSMCVFASATSDVNGMDLARRACEEALGVLTQAENEVFWADAQYCVGKAQAWLFDRDGDPRRIGPAIEAYRNVLAVAKPKDAGILWHSVNAEFGTLLFLAVTLGTQPVTEEMLREVIAVSRTALDGLPLDPAAVPIWERARKNLADALFSLGQFVPDAQPMIEAVEVIGPIIERTDRDKDPPAWAAVRNVLGLALVNWGVRSKIPTKILSGLSALHAAREVYSITAHPREWLKIMKEISAANIELYTLTGNSNFLCSAISGRTEIRDRALERERETCANDPSPPECRSEASTFVGEAEKVLLYWWKEPAGACCTFPQFIQDRNWRDERASVACPAPPGVAPLPRIGARVGP